MLAHNKKDFEKYFRENELPLIIEQEKKYQGTKHYIDYPLRREWWNNLIDSLQKDNQLPRNADNWCCPW